MTSLDSRALNHYVKCLDDLRFYSSQHLQIVPKEGGLVPFKLNNAQSIVHRKLSKQLKERGFVKAIVLKARQEGISTLTAGRFYRGVHLEPHRKAMVVAHKNRAAEAIFRTYERFHEYQDFMPVSKVSNTRGNYLELENGSILTVETAGDPEAGRGQTVHYLHASELGFWPNAENVWTALFQTVPDSGSEIIIESTANGVGNFFHKLWQQAESGESDFIPIFLPWWIHEEYKVKLNIGERNAFSPQDAFEEQAFTEGLELEGELHKLTADQLVWRRRKIRNLGGNERKFKQEYPSSAREAFVVSGNSFFDLDALEELESRVKPPLYRGTLAEQGGKFVIQRDPKGWLKVFKEPVEGHLYVIGADTAYGAQGRVSGLEEDYTGRGDFSCAYVMDVTTSEIVAELHGRIAPEVFAKQLHVLGHVYGSTGPVSFPATLAVERNHSSGTTAIKKLQQELRYPALYYSRLVAVKRAGRSTTVCGWVTTKSTRGPMLDELAEAIAAVKYPDDAVLSSRYVSIPVAECIKEMFTFIIVTDEKGEAKRAEAQEGSHDDRVMALAITLQAAQGAHKPEPMKQPEPTTYSGPTGLFDYGDDDYEPGDPDEWAFGG